MCPCLSQKEIIPFQLLRCHYILKFLAKQKERNSFITKINTKPFVLRHFMLIYCSIHTIIMCCFYASNVANLLCNWIDLTSLITLSLLTSFVQGYYVFVCVTGSKNNNHKSRKNNCHLAYMKRRCISRQYKILQTIILMTRKTKYCYSCFIMFNQKN